MLQQEKIRCSHIKTLYRRHMATQREEIIEERKKEKERQQGEKKKVRMWEREKEKEMRSEGKIKREKGNDGEEG